MRGGTAVVLYLSGRTRALTRRRCHGRPTWRWRLASASPVSRWPWSTSMMPARRGLADFHPLPQRRSPLVFQRPPDRPARDGSGSCASRRYNRHSCGGSRRIPLAAGGAASAGHVSRHRSRWRSPLGDLHRARQPVASSIWPDAVDRRLADAVSSADRRAGQPLRSNLYGLQGGVFRRADLARRARPRRERRRSLLFAIGIAAGSDAAAGATCLKSIPSYYAFVAFARPASRSSGGILFGALAVVPFVTAYSGPVRSHRRPPSRAAGGAAVRAGALHDPDRRRPSAAAACCS